MKKKNDLVKDIMQLSPEGEVNSGGYTVYRDAKRQSIYPPLFTDPEEDTVNIRV